MRVDARDVKIHCAAEHVNLAVGQKVGQVLLHDMGGAVIAAREAAKQLAAAVVPPRDRLALQLRTAERMPGRGSDILFAEGTGLWEIVQGGQAKTKARHDGGAEVSVDRGGSVLVSGVPWGPGTPCRGVGDPVKSPEKRGHKGNRLRGPRVGYPGTRGRGPLAAETY